MKRYFEKPTQVKFFDELDEENYGIAYRDEIICGCCGCIFQIEKIYEYAQREKPIEELGDWVDFTDWIK